MRNAARWSIVLPVVYLVGLAAPAAAQTSDQASDNAAADLVAAQIRDQGYACDAPASAKPDQSYSEPDETAWILICKNASYRVRLVPDMAAQVEQID